MNGKILIALFLSAIVFAGCDCKNGTQLQLDNSEVLWATNHEKIFFETWHQKVLLGQPIYMIYEQKEDETNKEVLFTVETEFQESVPGHPQFFTKDGEAFIQDATTSYLYSVKSRRFITNTWLADVYQGGFTNRLVVVIKH